MLISWWWMCWQSLCIYITIICKPQPVCLRVIAFNLSQSLIGDRLLPIRWLVQSPCGQMQSSTGWACCNTEPLVAAATCYWSSKAKKEKKEPNDPNHWLFLVAVFNLLCLSYKSVVGFHKLLRPKPNELYVFNKKFRIKWYTQTIQLR